MSCCCSMVLGLCQSIRNTDEESHSTTMTQLSIAPFISKKKPTKNELNTSAEQGTWKMHEW